MKYRERSEVQRWLFRRELEKFSGRPVFHLDECGVDHRLYREFGRAPRGERIYEAVAGKRRERTSIMGAFRAGKLVAPLAFQGSCNTEVVDVYFAQVLLPALPPGSVIVAGQRQLSSIPDHFEAGGRRRLPPVVPAGLFPRPQPHRTFLGHPQDPSP